MSKKIPTINKISPRAIAFMVFFEIVLFVIWRHIIPEYHILLGFLTFMFLVFLVRFSFARHHVAGMKLLHKRRFEEALKSFEKSYEFFQKHTWIDKFRHFLLLSVSVITFKEMALINIAFCYSQIQEGEKAIMYYQKTLQEFPSSVIAQTALNFINAIQNEKHENAKK